MADLGEDGTDVTTGSVLRVRGDVEIQPGSNLATLTSIPSGLAKIALHEGGVDKGDVNTIDVLNGSNISGYASVSGDVGSIKFILAHNNTLNISSSGTEVLTTTTWNDYDVIYITGSGNKTIRTIPQPLDDNGAVTGKRLLVITGASTASVTFVHNYNVGTSAATRLFCSNLNDVVANQLDVTELIYSPLDSRWHTVTSFAVKGRNASSGVLTGRNLFFDSAVTPSLTFDVATVASELRIRGQIDDLPISLLADIADNTWLGNISGGGAPTANSLSGLAGNFLTYNATTHAFDVSLASVTYTAGDGIDLASNVFSADVSDFAGTGLEDDGSNDLRVKWGSSRTVSPGTGSGTLAILDTDEEIRIDPTGTFTYTSITGGYEGQLVFVNCTTGGGDLIVWQNDGVNVRTPNGNDVNQSSADLVALYRSDNSEDRWYVLPLGEVQTGQIQTSAVTNAKLADMTAGTVKGRQVDAGTGAPVNLTGLEQGENVRFNTISTIALTPGGGSGSGGEYVSSDFSAITSITTHVVFTMTGSGTAEIDGFPAITGKMLFVRASTLASDQAISWTNLSAVQAGVDSAGRIRVPEGPRIWDQTGSSAIVAYGNSVYDLIDAPIADGYLENVKLANGSSTGQIKQWNGSAWTDILLVTAVDAEAPGRLIAFTEYAAGSSGTHTPNASTARMLIERQAGGGGAGGVQGASSQARAASGGGAGGYDLEWDEDPQTGSQSYSVGSGGSGGSGSTGANGSDGGNTFYRGTVLGGTGSGGVTTNNNPQTAVGEGGTAVTSTGQDGSQGWSVSNTAGPAIGGKGGDSVLGQGGHGTIVVSGAALNVSNNRDATGFGAGGGGGSVVNSINDCSGGSGSDGILRIWEFT